MLYLDLYNHLRENNPELSLIARVRVLLDTARCSHALRAEIARWLETGQPSAFAVNIDYTRPDGSRANVSTDYLTLVGKARMAPLQALLYLGWLERDPATALVANPNDSRQAGEFDQALREIDPEVDQAEKELDRNATKSFDLNSPLDRS